MPALSSLRRILTLSSLASGTIADFDCDTTTSSLLHEHDGIEAHTEKQHDEALSQKTRTAYYIAVPIILCFSAIGVVSTIIWLTTLIYGSNAYVPVYDSNYTVSYVNNPCDCGSSVSEAISLGCVFDQLSSGWLPPRCRDDSLTLEFSQLGDGPDGNWQYWADRNHTQPLTLEEVSRYADNQPAKFHMSYEWHVQRCFMLWRKEHRMKAVPGRFYDPRSDSEHHILHCINMITKRNHGTSAGAFLIG